MDDVVVDEADAADAAFEADDDMMNMDNRSNMSLKIAFVKKQTFISISVYAI